MTPEPHHTPARPSTGPGFSPWRLVTVMAVMAAVVVVLHATPLAVYVKDVQRLKAAVAAHGPMGWLLFMLAAAGLIAAGFPRLAVCGIAGFLFGFKTALVLTQFSSLAAAYATFLFVRWTGVHWAMAKLAQYRVLQVVLHAQSPWSVFVVRQLPIHGSVVNAFLAATQVRHRDFLVGSFFGFLPYATVATLVGSGVGKNSPALAWLQLGCACLIAVASTLAVMRIRARLATVAASTDTEETNGR